MPRFSIRPVLILVAIIACCVALMAWPANRFVYSRFFGNYCLGIETGAEIDANGLRHQTLETSYYDPPQVMYRIWTFRIPDDRPLTFETAEHEQSGLFCIYDTNGWGYLIIVNTRSNEMFSSIPMPEFTSETIDWYDEYELLKSHHPAIPYREVFENAIERQNAG